MFPKLKVVQIASIIPVASFDESHAAHIYEEISKSGFIKNLLSLASIGKHKFLLLDDSAILAAIRRLGLSVVPAQLLDVEKDAEMEVQAYLSEFDLSPFSELANTFPRQMTIIPASNSAPHNDCQKNTLRAVLIMPDKSMIKIEFRRNDLSKTPQCFIHFLDLIGRRHCPKTAISTHEFRSGNLKVGQNLTHLRIDGLCSTDLQFMANHGFLFPSGLLQIHPRMKVIGINYPIAVLSEQAPAREKERFLCDLFGLRLKSGHADYFRGGVYLLNG
jgi:hypothetical protein